MLHPTLLKALKPIENSGITHSDKDLALSRAPRNAVIALISMEGQRLTRLTYSDLTESYSRFPQDPHQL